MNSAVLKRIKLPASPGVYFFKRKKEILYIGKATSLRSRTKSYFAGDLIHTRGPLILDMVFKADAIDWQETDSVLEALILEANLIKKHQPYYNTREKDDKSFNYVCITKEYIPKVLIVRGKNVKHSVFNNIYGPYTSGTQLREATKIIRKIFPFLDDKNKNYLEFYRQISLAPDINDRKLYLQNIKNINLFFEGKKKKILQNLRKQMKEYAKAREFEKAGEIKRQIFALKHINDVALINSPHPSPLLEPPCFPPCQGESIDPPLTRGGQEGLERGNSNFRIEAYDVAHLGGKNMAGVMIAVENGEVNKNEYRKFSARGGSAFGGKTVLGDSKANDTGALTEVLERRLAHKEWAHPDLIVVDGGVAQLNAARAVLRKMGLGTPVVSVLKDEKHKPKDIMGDQEFGLKYKKAILLANSEAHRFAIAYHKNMRARNFLK